MRIVPKSTSNNDLAKVLYDAIGKWMRKNGSLSTQDTRSYKHPGRSGDEQEASKEARKCLEDLKQANGLNEQFIIKYNVGGEEVKVGQQVEVKQPAFGQVSSVFYRTVPGLLFC